MVEIKILPAINSARDLKKATNKKKPNRCAKCPDKPPPRKTYHDDICHKCPNQPQCKYPCPPITWIDGNQPMKETIAPTRDYIPQSDYNATLHEMITHRRMQWDQAIEIPDYRIRLITLALLGGIPIRTISQLIHISRMHLYRVINVTP